VLNWGPGNVVWVPLTRSGAVLRDRGPLNLLAALRECKIKNEDAAMLGKK